MRNFRLIMPLGHELDERRPLALIRSVSLLGKRTFTAQELGL